MTGAHNVPSAESVQVPGKSLEDSGWGGKSWRADMLAPVAPGGRAEAPEYLGAPVPAAPVAPGLVACFPPPLSRGGHKML